MGFYRKKPVVIEAVRYIPGLTCEEVADFLNDDHDEDDCFEDAEWGIYTPEGLMWASPGDWIIKGIEEEFYPCKDSIFRKTYEPYDE